VVVTYNSEGVIGPCLDRLPAAFGSVPYELVVADNDSRDTTVALVGLKAPDASIVQLGRNAGYAAGINAALSRRTWRGPVLVLNPDVRLEPNAVQPLVATLGTAGVGVAVPRIIGADGATCHSLRRDPSVLRAWGEALLGGNRAGRFARLGEVVTDPEAYQRPGQADWATGAVMLISAECAARVGPWDEGFFLYSEETDFAIRARGAGFDVQYVPSSVAVHLGGESNTAPQLWTVLVRSRIRLYRKYHGPIATSAFTSAVIVNEAVRAAAGRQTSRAAIRQLPQLVTAGRGSSLTQGEWA
jgi:GT2 family glycosyltransferase